MKVIKPIDTTTSILTSSTIAEPDTGETVWSAGTYNTGDIVVSTTTHKKYQSSADINTLDPEDDTYDLNGVGTKWVIIGTTNRYAMFDNVNGTQSTTTTGSLIVEVTPDMIVDSLAFFNITWATAIEVTVTDPTAGIVYNTSIPMQDNSEVVGMYSWLFSPIVNISRYILLDLPPYKSATIKVEFTGTSSMGVGTMVYGGQIDLGKTLIGVSDEGVDYSIRDIDDFGDFKIVRRRTADLIDFNCFAVRGKYNYIKNQLKELSSIPTVWVGNEDDISDGTAVFGYYRRRVISIDTPNLVNFTIQIQGLT